jgi:hypothetical protein
MGARQSLGVLVHLLGVEKLGAKGSFVESNHASATVFGHLTRYGQDENNRR